MSSHRAFTLIELLVVVTIIAVLLALLTPALDRVIYRADLTICASRLRAIAGGMTVYAAAHKRFYPHNFFYERNFGWHAPLLRTGGAAAGAAGQQVGNGVQQDIRPLLRPYFSVSDTLVDPMIKSLPVDLDVATHNLVYGSYSLWNGWRWSTALYPVDKRQAKVGDYFNWRGENKAAPGREYRWDILAGDFMRANLSATGVPDGGYWTCHPTVNDTSRLGVVNGPATTGTTSLYSFWIGLQPGRDSVDYNVIRQDNAVQILDNVAYDDERLIDVPEYNTGAGEQDLYHQLPIR